MISSCTTTNTSKSKIIEPDKHLTFKESIRQVIKKNKEPIRNCYENGLKTNKNLHGKIVIKWHFIEGGVVTKSEVLSSTMDSKEVPLCIAKTIKAFTFPDSGYKEAVTRFPFIFSSREQDTKNTDKKIIKLKE